ncbi:MAG: dihydropteroate synthase [Candidatus Poribacteria bacterium]|nr:dihydropteroate synthase [Candidatus Poribacteria bacterium]
MGLDNGSKVIIIGENIHTSRVVRRKGKLVNERPNGDEAVRYLDNNKKRRYLVIPEKIKQTQDYQEGRVKHITVAIQSAMSGQGPESDEGMKYLYSLAQRQINAGADFLDLNVDEISVKPEEQQIAMQWIVKTIQPISSVPLSIDSSSIDTLKIGLETSSNHQGRVLLNSASLERLDALDLVKQHDTQVIVTAAGEAGMPQNADERVANASRMVENTLSKGISIEDIFIDPLVFPISVDAEFGNHCLDAIRLLRQRYGNEIHITGGFSNVSFGLPSRRLINDVFINLAVDAGADSGIIDPVTSKIQDVLNIDRNSRPYQLAQEMLLGVDLYCKNFLRAYRKGELQVKVK